MYILADGQNLYKNQVKIVNLTPGSHLFTGYHLLLEKPMAVDEEDCEEIARVCTKSGVLVSVCHVLRYFPPVLKIKEVIESGAIGKVVNINHTENIGYWHFAHSFVRQH